MTTQPLIYVALGAGVALLVAIAVWRASVALDVRRGHVNAVTRAARAMLGEANAEAMLINEGYEILDRQARHTWYPMLDDESIPTELRVDFLVERDGQRFAAEVKTGDLAPSLSTAATRRQLLEYAIALPIDGVLLVTPETGIIQRVTFPSREILREAPTSSLRAILVGVVLGIAATTTVVALAHF